MADANQIERLLDLCFLAKKVTETLPALPKGVKQRHNFVLFEVYKIHQAGEVCHVVDIARRLNTTLPSITKLVGELEKMGFVEKTADPQDKRAVQISLTSRGLRFVNGYMLGFHEAWAKELEGVSEEDIRTAERTIQRFKMSMPDYRPGRPESGPETSSERIEK